jgi:hypothetical protein
MKWILLIAIASTLCAEEVKIELKNPGFDDGLEGWSLLKGTPKVSVKTSKEAAKTGEAGLHLEDDSEEIGLDVVSDMHPAKEGFTYRLQFNGKNFEGPSTFVGLRFLNAARKKLEGEKESDEKIADAAILAKGAAGKNWKEYTVKAVAPEGTAFVQVFIHTGIKVRNVSDIDDVVLFEVAP